jgi:hypothetical protein
MSLDHTSNAFHHTSHVIDHTSVIYSHKSDVARHTSVMAGADHFATDGVRAVRMGTFRFTNQCFGPYDRLAAEIMYDRLHAENLHAI